MVGCIWSGEEKRETRALKWGDRCKLPILELAFCFGISQLQRCRFSARALQNADKTPWETGPQH